MVWLQGSRPKDAITQVCALLYAAELSMVPL